MKTFRIFCFQFFIIWSFHLRNSSNQNGLNSVLVILCEFWAVARTGNASAIQFSILFGFGWISENENRMNKITKERKIRFRVFEEKNATTCHPVEIVKQWNINAFWFFFVPFFSFYVFSTTLSAQYFVQFNWIKSYLMWFVWK